MLLRGALAAGLLLASGGPSTASESTGPVIQSLASPVTVRLRGLSAVSDHVAWASGREGTVVRTVDRGRTWAVFHVPGAELLDFRDVHGFSAREAVVMAAGPGQASKVYRTDDGGRTWSVVLENPDADGFFDCIDFDEKEGRLLGDPVAGRFAMFRSHDRGRSWARTPGPTAAPGEAAFAASGTCVARTGSATLAVTGGAVARVHYLPDALVGKSEWHAVAAANASPSASTGLFSIARREHLLLAVGGDYSRPALPPVQLAIEAAGTNGCVLPAKAAPASAQTIDPWCRYDFHEVRGFAGIPGGYRSAIACARVADPVCIATGPDGNDVQPRESAAGSAWWEAIPTRRQYCCDAPASSIERAGTWQTLPGAGYESVASAGRVFWFSGDGGRLGRLELPAR
jgi:photosystem II stability/assembly factor-like uncharacterized protein